MQSVSVSEVPQGAQFIDVREKDEYAGGHAAGTVNIPLSELDARYQEVDFTQPAYIICLSGGRSARACSFLEANGANAINVSGGTKAWIEANLPLEK